MIDNRVETRGIKTSGILNEVIKLYKANHKLFLKITFFIFLIQTFSSALNLFKYAFMGIGLILFLFYTLFLFIIMIVLIYYRIKFSIALYAGISERYKDKEIDIKDALSIASEKVWRFVGVGLQLFLVLVIPASIAIISFSFYHLNKRKTTVFHYLQRSIFYLSFS